MTGVSRGYATICGAAVLLVACSGGDPVPDDTRSADVAAIHALIDRIEQTFRAGDLDAAMTVFTGDAEILGQGLPDIVGLDAIRATYQGMMEQFNVAVDLTTTEIEVAGDLAYERGTYTLKLTDKANGQIASDVENRHVHILKRQPDGAWRTWRMIVNSVEPAAQ